jgi:hypothetical protein
VNVARLPIPSPGAHRLAYGLPNSRDLIRIIHSLPVRAPVNLDCGATCVANVCQAYLLEMLQAHRDVVEKFLSRLFRHDSRSFQ